MASQGVAGEEEWSRVNTTMANQMSIALLQAVVGSVSHTNLLLLLHVFPLMAPIRHCFAGRGRGRWMEQNEYFDSEPYEYPPPGRGKLGVTYHIAVLLARPYLSSPAFVTSQVVAWEEGEGHGAPEAAGVVRC